MGLGNGCDVTNEDAVRRVCEIKRRADSKAMLVLVDSPVKVEFLCAGCSFGAWDLIEVADKPLTIIYSKSPQPGFKICLAEDGSIGIRVTNRSVFSVVCAQLGFKAIVSTFANVSGQPEQPILMKSAKKIKSSVDYIVISTGMI